MKKTGRNSIPISILVVRNELIKQVWDSKRYSMKEIGMMFGLKTTQTFDIIKSFKRSTNKN